METFQIIADDSLNERSNLSPRNNFFETKTKFYKKAKKVQKLILVFFLLILKAINNSPKDYYNFNKLVNNETVKLINLNYTKRQYKIMGLEYLNKIKRSKINNTRNKVNNPKISVIIPIYNCQNTIELSLKSIHFQNINDLEIILINDLSSDNSSQIIESFQNIDQRIVIIKNKKNMGTLYSRSIGALKAKGEYLIGLDNDDFLSFEKMLETSYLNAKINDFDIAEIKSLNIPNYDPRYKEVRNGNYIYHPDNLILHQPELGLFSITSNNNLSFTDHFAWGKFIKSKVYKNALNKMGKTRYSTYNCWTEDMSIVFVLFNTAKSYIFLNLFGIFRLKAKTTTTHKLNNEHKFLSYIFYLDILFDFSKNNYKTKNYIAQYALGFNIKRINRLDNKGKMYFKSIINKLIDCSFVSKEYNLKLKINFNRY
jgi:glycosyltransferase involved in cell wall biosynthesis